MCGMRPKNRSIRPSLTKPVASFRFKRAWSDVLNGPGLSPNGFSMLGAPKTEERGTETEQQLKAHPVPWLAESYVAAGGSSAAPRDLLLIRRIPLLSGFSPGLSRFFHAHPKTPFKLPPSIFSGSRLTEMKCGDRRRWTSRDDDRLTGRGKRFAGDPHRWRNRSALFFRDPFPHGQLRSLPLGSLSVSLPFIPDLCVFYLWDHGLYIPDICPFDAARRLPASVPSAPLSRTSVLPPERVDGVLGKNSRGPGQRERKVGRPAWGRKKGLGGPGSLEPCQTRPNFLIFFNK